MAGIASDVDQAAVHFGADPAAGVAGNMGIRLRPDLCGQGYGQETLGPLLEGALDAGMARVRLDVAAPNVRAIRCYEKCGMQATGEFWREGDGPADPDDPKWADFMPHLRRDGEGWKVRFHWMEIRR